MDALIAIPTSHGLSVLNSSLKSTVTKYALIGATAHDAADDELGTFYTGTIENSFYDSNGVLTMQVELPVATDFGKYLYRIAILDATDQLVVTVATPKQALASGIGGFMTIKIAVTGEAGEVVFKASDYVTEVELENTLTTLFTNKFTNSLDSNGYQILPSGLILQWGKQERQGHNESVLLPISFPNAGFVGLATVINAEQLNPGGDGGAVDVGTITKTTLFIRHNGRPNADIYWLAIGY